ncbi:hypothetical protein [Egicoccus sp. AB-alg2]|uniref:hypothetical protein n=1 Tax=Egicoccus sp. AB-alg2 TaxID=3242693 RepID=UPI00359D1460
MTGTHLLRTAPAVAVPLVTAALLAWHPRDPELAVALADIPVRWAAIHLWLLLAMPLLALLLRDVLRGIDGRAAAAARTLAVPAAALYAAFDALVGLATGLLARQAAALPPAQRAGAQALVQWWWEVPAVVGWLSAAAVASWAIAVAAAAIAAHRAGRGPLVAYALLACAVLFAAGHPGLTGAVAMTAFAVAVAAARAGIGSRVPQVEAARP